MTFKVGDRVKYIDYDAAPILRGRAYTVRALKNVKGSATEGVYLEEFSGEHMWWWARRFELANEDGKKPHKWAKEIKAWADGADIQYRYLLDGGIWSEWVDTTCPQWVNVTASEYRVKPEKKPDVVVATWIELVAESSSQENDVQSILDVFGRKENINCSFTFDGETGKLKAVQLLSK